jgi:hypothetical protein
MSLQPVATTGQEEAHARQKVEGGRNAALVLENPAYKAAWTALRDSISAAWRNCAVGDTDTMELLHSQARMLDTLQNLMSQAVNGGKAAQNDLEMMALKAAEAERNQRFISRGMRAVGFGKR